MTRIPAQSGTAFILKKHQYLKIVDPLGEQVCDLFCFDLHQPQEALSSGRSIDDNEKILLTTGDRLSGNSGELMLTIARDTCGRHDFLLTPCNLKMFQDLAKNTEYHPSCHENLCQNLARFDVDLNKITSTFNIFMNVEVDFTGKVKIHPPLSKPGDFIILRAEKDLIVGLTACSDEGTNHGSCKPIDYQILDSLELS